MLKKSKTAVLRKLIDKALCQYIVKQKLSEEIQWQVYLLDSLLRKLVKANLTKKKMTAFPRLVN